ncbi:MAG: 23S rRNA (adenine(1618)-N(6))-methyltransferase RlmF [Bacteroidetes bacterium]|nr:23S rRNA (adenine(1618)-N(6))-methyltransferase RlmF [Bacteroidota bacterium]
MAPQRRQKTIRRTDTFPGVKESLHPRNRNNGRYDFPALIAQYPALGPFVFINRFGNASIDFTSAEAVRTLNAVLLEHHYGIRSWQFPAQHLCPPIPGRADYLHYLADLLATEHAGVIPSKGEVTVLDIGTGATCIYPLIGRAEYGWRFVASETDAASIASCRAILAANAIPEHQIDVRSQPHPDRFFSGIIRPSERFDMTMCNPPFHSAMAQAVAGTVRKWKNLGTNSDNGLNFGGKHHELVYPGGEIGFISGMAAESVQFNDQVLWFTTLVSRHTSLPIIRTAIESAGVQQVRIVPMAQGQKKSRFIAWTFHTKDSIHRWRRERWENG